MITVRHNIQVTPAAGVTTTLGRDRGIREREYQGQDLVPGTEAASPRHAKCCLSLLNRLWGRLPPPVNFFRTTENLTAAHVL